MYHYDRRKVCLQHTFLQRIKCGLRCVVVVVAFIFLTFPAISSKTNFVDGQTILTLPHRTNPIYVVRPPLLHRTHTTGRSVENPAPTSGDQRLLILLVDFSDQPGLFTGSAWQNAFFGDNGSFAAYYREVSYGKLRYYGDIVSIKGGVPVKNSPSVAYIRLDHPVTYYADGQHGSGDFPKNSVGVVYHALQKLDAAGFDFSQYSTNMKLSNNLFVAYGGSDHAETNDSVNCLHSISWQISYSRGSPFVSKKGYTVDDFTIGSDQAGKWSGTMAGIGTAVHEQGHALGMYDLYDFSYKATGVGNYDVMGFGLYGFTGDETRPSHFGAFPKEFYGWVQPTIPPIGTTRYTLAPVETSPQIIKLYPKGNTTSKEYFLIENRQPIGFDQDWITGGFCAGIIIWKIDRFITETYPDDVNSPPSLGGGPHHGVVVVEADGRYDMIHSMNYGECSDTWAIGRVWNDTSTPNSRTWNGASSDLSVVIASQSGNAIDIIVTVGGSNGGTTTDPCLGKPASPSLLTPVNGYRTIFRSVTLTWTAASCSSAYYNIWVVRGSSSGTTVSQATNLSNPSYKTKSLPYRQKYYWIVQACTSGGCADSNWQYFRIG